MWTYAAGLEYHMCSTLIVEDNPTFRRSLKEVLCTHFPEMCVEEASNGVEAFEKVQSNRPDLVFMDIKLPGTNGLEITKRLREDPRRMVVVILTSYDIPEYREAAMMSGADYFLTKGTTSREELLNLVDSVILQIGTTGTTVRNP